MQQTLYLFVFCCNLVSLKIPKTVFIELSQSIYTRSWSVVRNIDMLSNTGLTNVYTISLFIVNYNSAMF